MPVMNIGANSTQTPLCHSSMQLANIYSNVYPERAVWLTGWRTQVLQIVCTNHSFHLWKWYIVPCSCCLTWESVVSSPRVSAKVWPIQLLYNDGPQCSQYRGSGKSNYGHCVCAACLSRSLHHLSVVNYLSFFLWSRWEQWGCWESWKTRGKMRSDILN